MIAVGFVCLFWAFVAPSRPGSACESCPAAASAPVAGPLEGGRRASGALWLPAHSRCRRALGRGPAAALAATGGGAGVSAPVPRLSSAVYFPAGRFVLGSSVEEALAALAQCASQPFGSRCRPADFTAEVPRHEVDLSAFWLDRTEVTRDRYRRCVEAAACPSAPLALWGGEAPGVRLPATHVRFQEARAFCHFRGARLPTEAEFERAARGQQRRRYAWGRWFNRFRLNSLPFAGSSLESESGALGGVFPVGCFPDGATPEGALDLAGNLAEWALDRFEPGYSAELQVNPRGPSSSRSLQRAVRGGSYRQAPVWQRAAARRGLRGDSRVPDVGFRCVRPAVGRAAG